MKAYHGSKSEKIFEEFKKVKGEETMNKVVKEAKKILEERGLRDALPELEIGQECTLADVWDGNGETPLNLDEGIGDYSYDLTPDDFIEYEYEIVDKGDYTGEGEDQGRLALDVVVKITKIWIG